jgi:hypothetical protein
MEQEERALTKCFHVEATVLVFYQASCRKVTRVEGVGYCMRNGCCRHLYTTAVERLIGTVFAQAYINQVDALPNALREGFGSILTGVRVRGPVPA